MLSNSLQESARMCLEHTMCTFLARVTNAVYVSRSEDGEQFPSRRFAVFTQMPNGAYIEER